MVYTKYKFTPGDIAAYLIADDLPYKQCNRVIDDLFENYNALIVFPYRKELRRLRSETKDIMLRLESDKETLDEADRISEETGNPTIRYSSREPDRFGAYFKLIKLRLMYSGISCYKIQLKVLLNDFGYKYKTAPFREKISRTLHALRLIPYVDGHKSYDLHLARSHETITFRLDNEQ